MLRGRTDRYRSFFWPAVLILVGLIALVVNTGLIPVDRLYLLLNLWPVILIVLGLELLVRRSTQGPARDLATAIIVLLAVIGAGAYTVLSPNPSAAGTTDSSTAIGNLENAAAEIDAGGATINVSSGSDLGADLYRAHIEYSGPKPQVEFNRSTGSLRISQGNESFGFFGSRRFTVTLQLNPTVPWKITENSGASTDTIDAGSLHISSLTLNTGASRDEITLGAPSGIVPVTVNGGALTVHLHRPSGVPASVAVSGGAVSLNADSRQLRAIGDLNYESPNFAGATDGYRIQINGGACTVTLDSRASS
ncbi:MAG: hypothetical protein E6J53_06620 [Chloroflexi bacterium]|nr:MAG: hypothetical protein E6J53_06620 [Chloroflexota bacterium]